MANTAIGMKLCDLPLWRLIVALDDAERVAGSDSPTARALAQEIKLRLASNAAKDKAKGAARG